MCFVGLTRNNQPVYDYDEFMQISLARYMTSQEAMMGILSEPLTRLSEKVHRIPYSVVTKIPARYLGSFILCSQRKCWPGIV